MTGRIDAETLRDLIVAGTELALIDVREEAAFSRAHLLFACCVPLSRLELSCADLVPRRTTPVVLCDASGTLEESSLGGGDLAEQAASRLTGFGYTDVSILDGGIAAWSAAGFELFSGVNVPSKAFGEFIEHRYETPSIAAEDLDRSLRAGDDVVVLDSRPLDEYRLMSIPTGVCTPGAELVYRVADMAPSPETLVVVNCAGRTRSIIGAQSLINAGIPNRVMALRNGTMGWHLAGLEVSRGASSGVPPVSAAAEALARQRAAAVAKRFDLSFIDAHQLERLRDDSSRSLFVLDVRGSEEFEAGHLPGSISAPGGQLVQATDRYVGVRGARLVLVDDTRVRAIMTASWLVQMGMFEVHVLDIELADTALETGRRLPEVLGLEKLSVEMLSPPVLARLQNQGEALVVDVSASLNFTERHIEGARHGVRSRLARQIAGLTPPSWLVFTSEDGLLARFAARDAALHTDAKTGALMGGNRAWEEAGLPMVSGRDGLAEDPDDVWLKPYDKTDDVEAAMREYLTWEIDLVAQIERDGTTRFKVYD